VYPRHSDHTVRSPTIVDGESWRFHDRHEPSASFDLVAVDGGGVDRHRLALGCSAPDLDVNRCV
jgi:hypothetical protein